MRYGRVGIVFIFLLSVSLITHAAKPIMNEHNIKYIINSIPTLDIHLFKFNKKKEIEHSAFVKRALSDHDIIAGLNQHGNFASWNILNPDSPVSPGFNPEGFEGLYKLYYEEEKQEHIILVANTLASLMEQGIDAIALQEVPAMNSSYFSMFVETMKRLSLEKNLNIDFNAFYLSYALTKSSIAPQNSESNYNKFATALLIKGDRFTLREVIPVLNERGSDYVLYSQNTLKSVHLINIHGDYNQYEELATFMAEKSQQENTVILGDSNIALSRNEALKTIATIKGYCFTPSTNLPNTNLSFLTLDCLLSKDKTQFITKGNPTNYADN